MDPRRPLAEAVAIAGGRVQAVGTRAELRRLAGAGTERIDCGGATVLPGIVDPHLHLVALAARHVNLDCAAATSARALLDGVRRHAAALPARAWVRGEGLDERRLDRLPTPAELDAAAGGRPVRLRHRSRHASLLGTAALRLLGARDGSGLVTAREAALGILVGPLAPAALAGGLACAARELAAFGVTTVADATPRGPRALRALAEAVRALPVRVFWMRRAGTRDAARGVHGGPVKIVVDETPTGLRPRPDALARRIVAAASAGDQVAVHCVGAGTLVAALAAFAALPRRMRARRRHRLEHVAECPPPLVARIAALGLVVVTNPAFVHWRGDAYREETDGTARRWLYRARSLAAAGVVLAGASDAPVVSPNPWVGIAAARSRRTAAGAVLGATERLPARDALALFTTRSAFALHADDLGRLVPGAPADVVVVEPDPLRAPPDEVLATRVRMTLAGGVRVWPS
jgi:predicted amidohydrolase YtcJ